MVVSTKPNPPLNSDPACIALRSLSTSRFLGSAQRLGAGGARLASFVRWLLMANEPTWHTIRTVHRTFLVVQFGFVPAMLSVLICSSPENMDSRLFAVWAACAAAFLLIAAWPAPCPGCGKPFLLFSVGNWGRWFTYSIQDTFHPFRQLGRLVFPSCPSCDLTIGSTPPNP